jgi:hypothetical protein
MEHNALRSEICARFKRVDNELSKFKKFNQCWMYGCAVGALLNATKIVEFGANIPNVMNVIGFGAFTGFAYMSQKSIVMARQNRELYEVIDNQRKQIPTAFYDNNKTGRLALTMMEGAVVLGLGAWMIGKMSAANVTFLGGCVGLACMVYEYHLTKKNRKILSAELPKGVMDEHTR